MPNVRTKRPRAAAGAKYASGSLTSDESLLSGMIIATALKENDSSKLTSMLQSCLPGKGITVTDVSITKSLGEAFTGGRSTPVYYITCNVMRPGWAEPKHRHFVAKLVMMEGDATTNSRLAMKRESYAVERRFYDVVAPRIRDGACMCSGSGLEIPKLLASDRDGSKPHSAVCFLMNDVQQRGFPRHPDFLSVSEAKRALKWVAKLHVMFWNDDKTQDWRRDLWTRGGYWTDGKDSVDNQTVSSQWSQTVRWLQSHHPELVSEEIKGIGKRIQALAEPLDHFLSMESSGPKGTLIHGDFKAANIFLSETSADGDEDCLESDSVAVVDFQFTGGGLGAEDVAYVLYSDARGHYFEDELTLLRTYHEELIASLIERRKGGPSSLSFECFMIQYELSRIDFTRHLLGRGWVASTEGDALLVRALAQSLLKIDGGSPLSCEKEYIDRLTTLCAV